MSLGIHYDRIDVEGQYSETDGTRPPAEMVSQRVESLMQKIIKTPTCVLPSVIRDPYLEDP